jgi:hypothetical protein
MLSGLTQAEPGERLVTPLIKRVNAVETNWSFYHTPHRLFFSLRVISAQNARGYRVNFPVQALISGSNQKNGENGSPPQLPP